MNAPDETVLSVAGLREVDIETRSGDRVYRTVIWVALDDGDLFIRSYRGNTARWYQRALADPRVALVAGETRVEFRAVPAADPDSVRRATEGFTRKYHSRGSLAGMVRAEVLDTTLRLDPV